MRNLKVLLEESTKNHGENIAVALGDRELRYAELEEASNRVANTLMGLGVEKGDRVAMLLKNSPEFVALYFGIVKTGAIAVLLDTKYKISELTSLFSNCQPKVLVTENPFLEPLLPALPEFGYIKHIIELGANYQGRFLSYVEMMTTGVVSRVEVEPGPEDIATIAYTSGPTFSPRGVMLSHRDLVTMATIPEGDFQQTAADVSVLFALPLHHVVGLEAVLLASIARGSKVVMLPGLSISNLIDTIERERVTIFMGVPFIFILMIQRAEEEVKHDLSSIRLCCAGGAAMPPETTMQLKQLYGVDAAQFWGLTEATAHVTCQSVDGSGKPGSVGKALSGWEVRVVDDNGKELVSNQPGEVIVNGPMMKGYYNNPQATAEVIKDGWLYTGDIGRVTEDGELFILGRKKELIIVKGQNILPSDIEVVLHDHPKVAEAAVVGIPDKLRGEIIRAAVSLRPGAVVTEQEIKKFCLERIANYKVPKQVMFWDSLPRTATGKILKDELKK